MNGPMHMNNGNGHMNGPMNNGNGPMNMNNGNVPMNMNMNNGPMNGNMNMNNGPMNGPMNMNNGPMNGQMHMNNGNQGHMNGPMHMNGNQGPMNGPMHMNNGHNPNFQPQNRNFNVPNNNNGFNNQMRNNFENGNRHNNVNQLPRHNEFNNNRNPEFNQSQNISCLDYKADPFDPHEYNLLLNPEGMMQNFGLSNNQGGDNGLNNQNNPQQPPHVREEIKPLDGNQGDPNVFFQPRDIRQTHEFKKSVSTLNHNDIDEPWDQSPSLQQLKNPVVGDIKNSDVWGDAGLPPATTIKEEREKNNNGLFKSVEENVLFKNVEENLFGNQSFGQETTVGNGGNKVENGCEEEFWKDSLFTGKGLQDDLVSQGPMMDDDLGLSAKTPELRNMSVQMFNEITTQIKMLAQKQKLALGYALRQCNNSTDPLESALERQSALSDVNVLIDEVLSLTKTIRYS